MPRKTIWKQHRGRFVRHLHSDNHMRRFIQASFSNRRTRYQPMNAYQDHAVIRNPRMKPLIHNGKAKR